MDLSLPLRAVVPTLDGPVLRVLAGTTRPLTGREIARLASRGSEPGVRRVLHRLVDHGLVCVTTAGAACLYTANRTHLAWPAVETLVGMPQQLRTRLSGLLAAWYPAPALAGLFGSAARGDGATDSDIDLLLVRPDDVPSPLDGASTPPAVAWSEQVERLRTAVQAMTGNAAQIYEISLSELIESVRAGDHLAEAWRRELVVLAGPAAWEQLALR